MYKKNPVGTCGERTLFSCAKFLNMFQEICIAADHEKENDEFSLFNIFNVSEIGRSGWRHFFIL